MSWSDFLAFLNSPAIADDKNALEGWSPAKFRLNRRGKANVEAVSCLVLDDDANGLPLDRLVNIYHGAAGAVHSSHSSTPEHPKWRIILRLSRDVTAGEYDRLWAHVRKRVTDGGYLLDEATKDASRLWYVPASKEHGRYQWQELIGEPVPVDEILAASAANDETRLDEDRGVDHGPPPAPGLVVAGGSRRKASIAMLSAAWPAEHRHEAQNALAGGLVHDGMPEQEAIEFLCDVCRGAGNEERSKREASVKSAIAKRDAGEPYTGWPTLEKHIDRAIIRAARELLSIGEAETMRERIAEAKIAPAPPADDCGIVEVDGLRFESLGLDAPLPPIQYQVGQFIARGDVCMLVAHGNSLKTWFAFSLALAVATGRPWLGKFLAERGRVGILDFESGTYEVKRRLKLLGAKDAEVDGRLLRCSYPDADLMKPETWEALAKLRLDMLVLDSFAAATQNIDENEKRAADLLILAGKYAEVTSCSVVPIHHERKGSGGDARESVRGNTAIFAACDRIYRFSAPEEADGGIVRVTMGPLKRGAGRTPEPVRAELSDNGLIFIDGEMKVEEKPEDNRKIALRILGQAPAGVPKNDLLNLLKGRHDARREALSALVLAGLVVEYKSEKKVFAMIKPGIDV